MHLAFVHDSLTATSHTTALRPLTGTQRTKHSCTERCRNARRDAITVSIDSCKTATQTCPLWCHRNKTPISFNGKQHSLAGAGTQRVTHPVWHQAHCPHTARTQRVTRLVCHRVHPLPTHRNSTHNASGVTHAQQATYQKDNLDERDKLPTGTRAVI